MSELVTNTVRHGGSEPRDTLELRFDHDPAWLEIAVCQRAPVGSLRVATDQLERGGGWGLHLLEELTQAWGVDTDPHCVWFRLAA